MYKQYVVSNLCRLALVKVAGMFQLNSNSASSEDPPAYPTSNNTGMGGFSRLSSGINAQPAYAQATSPPPAYNAQNSGFGGFSRLSSGTNPYPTYSGAASPHPSQTTKKPVSQSPNRGMSGSSGRYSGTDQPNIGGKKTTRQQAQPRQIQQQSASNVDDYVYADTDIIPGMTRNGKPMTRSQLKQWHAEQMQGLDALRSELANERDPTRKRILQSRIRSRSSFLNTIYRQADPEAFAKKHGFNSYAEFDKARADFVKGMEEGSIIQPYEGQSDPAPPKQVKQRQPKQQRTMGSVPDAPSSEDPMVSSFNKAVSGGTTPVQPTNPDSPSSGVGAPVQPQQDTRFRKRRSLPGTTANQPPVQQERFDPIQPNEDRMRDDVNNPYGPKLPDEDLAAFNAGKDGVHNILKARGSDGQEKQFAPSNYKEWAGKQYATDIPGVSNPTQRQSDLYNQGINLAFNQRGYDASSGKYGPGGWTNITPGYQPRANLPTVPGVDTSRGHYLGMDMSFLPQQELQQLVVGGPSPAQQQASPQQQAQQQADPPRQAKKPVMRPASPPPQVQQQVSQQQPARPQNQQRSPEEQAFYDAEEKDIHGDATRYIHDKDIKGLHGAYHRLAILQGKDPDTYDPHLGNYSTEWDVENPAHTPQQSQAAQNRPVDSPVAPNNVPGDPRLPNPVNYGPRHPNDDYFDLGYNSRELMRDEQMRPKNWRALSGDATYFPGHPDATPAQINAYNMGLYLSDNQQGYDRFSRLDENDRERFSKGVWRNSSPKVLEEPVAGYYKPMGNFMSPDMSFLGSGAKQTFATSGSSGTPDISNIQFELPSNTGSGTVAPTSGNQFSSSGSGSFSSGSSPSSPAPNLSSSGFGKMKGMFSGSKGSSI